MRVILVDSSEVFRIGLKALLAEARDFVIAGEAGEPAAALATVGASAPELVIIDLEIGDGSGLGLVESIRQLAPNARVVLFTTAADELAVRQAASVGAAGLVLRTQSGREILAALREVAAGRTVTPPVRRGAADAPKAAVLDRLSAREREIFDLIIWGKTNKQVAVKLGISVKTVETHRSHINGKLQVHSAAELVRLASLCGVLSTPVREASSADTLAHGAHDPHVDRLAMPRLVAKSG